MSEILHPAIPWIGGIGAALTTTCWLPQAIRVVRHRETRAISLTTNLMLIVGLVFWLIYGIALVDWPLIASNSFTLLFTLIITAMKLRHG
jgi:MtN3 and saliva related transmembrane protein